MFKLEHSHKYDCETLLVEFINMHIPYHLTVDVNANGGLEEGRVSIALTRDELVSLRDALTNELDLGIE